MTVFTEQAAGFGREKRSGPLLFFYQSPLVSRLRFLAIAPTNRESETGYITRKKGLILSPLILFHIVRNNITAEISIFPDS